MKGLENVVKAVDEKVALFVESYGLSKTALTQILKCHKETLPEPNKFPESYDQA